MPKLTAITVASYVAQDKRREIRDALSPLLLIIQPKPKGSKSWAMRFRRLDGRPSKLTLGRVDLSGKEPTDAPVIGGVLTLGQARELAAQIARERARGVDVIGQYNASRSRAAAIAENNAANTFGAVAKEFFIEHKTRRSIRPRRWRDDARLIGLRWPLDSDPAKVAPAVIPGSLVSTWANRAIAEIDGHDIHAVVDDARRRGIPGLVRHNTGDSDARGRKMHGALSTLFHWAWRRRKVSGNPTTGVERPPPPPARERFLTNDEIKAFWKACEQIDQPYGAAAKLLLLTGARLQEVAGMRREELSDDYSVWTIPGSRTKNHRPLELQLPPLAQSIIAELPTIDGGYVFTVNGRRPVSSWARAKAELDKAMKITSPWRLHDLRRTAATCLADSPPQGLGIAPHIVEAILNHVSGFRAGVAGVYNKSMYVGEKKAALLRWAEHIEGLVTGREAKVTPLRRGARR